jgi:hypothetical protein
MLRTGAVSNVMFNSIVAFQLLKNIARIMAGLFRQH